MLRVARRREILGLTHRALIWPRYLLLHGLIAPAYLSIRLLHQQHPQLILALGGLREGEGYITRLIDFRRKMIVDNDYFGNTIDPKLQCVAACLVDLLSQK